MQSMTGFGASVAQDKDVRLEVSVKSVNGRYLDVRLHTPREYLGIEKMIKDIVRGEVLRGTVDVYIYRRRQEQNAAVKFDHALGGKVHAELTKMNKKLGIKENVNLSHVLQAYDFVSVEEDKSVSKKEETLVKKTLLEAIKKLKSEKAREGKALQKHLQGTLKSLDSLVKDLVKQRQKANEVLIERWQTRIQKAMDRVEVDESRLACRLYHAGRLQKRTKGDLLRKTEYQASRRSLVFY